MNHAVVSEGPWKDVLFFPKKKLRDSRRGRIYTDTNLVTMAFVHTVLEAVHAHDTSGIYCTIPAERKKEQLTLFDL